jgi:hypothetical protein
LDIKQQDSKAWTSADKRGEFSHSLHRKESFTTVNCPLSQLRYFGCRSAPSSIEPQPVQLLLVVGTVPGFVHGIAHASMLLLEQVLDHVAPLEFLAVLDQRQNSEALDQIAERRAYHPRAFVGAPTCHSEQSTTPKPTPTASTNASRSKS